MRLPSRYIRYLCPFFVLICVSVTVRAEKFLVTDFVVCPHTVYYRNDAGQMVEAQEPNLSAKRIQGWWFNSRDIFYNENIGIHARAILSKKLACYFPVVSQDELNNSLAKKRSALSKELDLSGSDLTRAIAKIDPLKLARELDADNVVCGKFYRVTTESNRFFGGVYSPVSMVVRVFNVRTGKCWFSQSYRCLGFGHSQYGSISKLSDKAVNDIVAARSVGMK